jgi:NADH-quinone oxidoreductase subunit E
MYNLKPVGKFMFEFCQTSPCCLNGVEDLMDYCDKLGVKIGETTDDGLLKLEAECLGACNMSYDASLVIFTKSTLKIKLIS